jgi:hypothetical protein
MNLLWLNMAALAVALLHCTYQAHRRIEQRKRRQLRERVAYLLWVAANQAGKRAASLAGH